MKLFRRTNLSAFFALVLLLGNVLPAFASVGRWMCPDGNACPLMNGGTHAVRAMSPTSCHKPPPISCCKRAAALQNYDPSPESMSAAMGCRFVPAVALRGGAVPLVAAEQADPRAVAPALPPLSLADLFTSLTSDRPDFSPPDDVTLPPTPIRAASPPRAPPLV